jgi:Cu/Ag efflux protein CusF
MRKYLLRTITAASLVAVALAFAAPVGAEEAKKEAKAEKPKAHQFTGEISAVDIAGKAVTVKNKDGETKVFVLTEKTKVGTAENKAAELKDLKVGDKVTVRFMEEDGKNVAQRIGPPAPPKKKEKPEEKK